MTKEKYCYNYAIEKYEPFKSLEEKYNLRLKKDSYYILRFDGKGMTKAFKIKHKAINEQFFQTMEDTFNEFCKANDHIIFGYSFSDEISILIKGNNDEKDDYNRIEKLLSLLSGKIALIFYRKAEKHALDLKNKDWIFDARIIELSKKEVIEYFLTRQAFAIDKYLMQLKVEYNINFHLYSSKSVIRALKKKGVNYDNLPAKYRYGLTYSNIEESCTFEFDANQSLLNKICFGKRDTRKIA